MSPHTVGLGVNVLVVVLGGTPNTPGTVHESRGKIAATNRMVKT